MSGLLLGWIQTFAATYNVRMEDILTSVGFEKPEPIWDSAWQDLWTLTLPQIGPILPYLLMVIVLVVRPQGLFGKRES